MRSALKEIMEEPVIKTIANAACIKLNISSSKQRAIEALLSLAWIAGAHKALWMPYPVLKKIVNTEETYQFAIFAIKGVMLDLAKSLFPDTSDDEMEELYAVALSHEKWKPVTDLIKSIENDYPHFLKNN